MSDVIAVNNLSLGLKTQFGVCELVSDISFAIRSGETLALVGESGCGKTLTSLALMRLLPQKIHYIEHSSIKFQGKDLLQISEDAMQQVRGHKIAMIFQEPMSCLNPVLTAGQQLDEVLKIHTKMSASQRVQRSIELFDAVGIADPEQRLKTYPHQLSGGMKQRVMIAIALACDPTLIIADEPTTALDVTIQSQILQLLADLQKRFGIAMLLVSHDLGVVAQLAHHVAVMYAGQIVETATVDNFFSKPLHPYSRQLFNVIPSFEKRHQVLTAIPGQVPRALQFKKGCRFANRCKLANEQCRESMPMLESVADGNVRCWHYKKPIPTESVVFQSAEIKDKSQRLALQNLGVSFPVTRGIFKQKIAEIKAVDGVSLQIHAGETVALVGESGCGKSTLAKAILKLINPVTGTVLLNSHNVLLHSDADPDCQMIFQDSSTSLNPKMLVSEIISEGLKQQSLSRFEINQRIECIVEQVGLAKDSLNRYPHEFSGGQRQRIGIARALVMQPAVIICDEPTSALDLSIQAQILNLLRQIQRQQQLAYLFISHDLSVVSYLADKIAVMYLGRIVEAGPVADIMKQPKHPYTQSLLRAIPLLDPSHRIKHVKGEQPSPSHPPAGCYFHPRCPHVMPVCKQHYPASSAKNGHVVNCFIHSL